MQSEKAYATLQAAGCPLEVICGAEVQIFQSLPEYRVDKMCIGESNVVLFELPEMPFQKWMVSAIENAVYKYSLIPVIAHIERCGYSNEQLRQFARIPNMFFQITVPELKYKKSIALLDTVSACGVPVVFGSDAHNMSTRTPQFNVLDEKMAEKAGLFNKSLKTTHAIIENCLFAQPILEKLIRTPVAEKVK